MELVYPPSPAPLMPRPNVDRPAPEILPGEEMLPVVEPTGMVIGRTPRRLVHGGSMLLHPVVHLHIIDRFGRLYLQKRAMTKDLLPGFWDTAVGGHVGYGEYIREALFRETSEELGLTRFNPIPLKTYVWAGEKERELVSVFAAVGHFELKPDPAEVSEGRWWDMKEIRNHLGKSVFTPNFEGEFVQLRKMLESLL